MKIRLLLGRSALAALLGTLLACSAPAREASGTQATGNQATQNGAVQSREGQNRETQGQTTRSGPRSVTPARDSVSGLPLVTVRELPPEGQRTLRLIRAGGPFPYRKDGSTFGNREGLLPGRPRGGYREYTVPTPGEDDRGARRIVCAALTPPDRECYYTADHYASFRRIRP